MALAEMLRERGKDSGEAALQSEEIQQRAIKMQTEAAIAIAKASAARAAFQTTVNARSAQITAALNAAVKAANEQAQDAGEFMRGFSLAAGGDPMSVDPQTARAAMETLKNNPNLKRLAEMLGWARKMVRGEWRKSPRARTELVGYEARPLQPKHMAGFEWAALLSCDETLHADWLRRALDGGIRHRKFGGKERQGRGPLVLVCDESGSMEGAPHALAVALEWARLEIARRDKREFYTIPFSGTGQFHVWQAPKPGEPDPQGLLAHLAHFFGGGTEPYSPIVKVLEVIEGHQLRADVLVITDAAFGAPPDGFTRKLAEVKQRQPLRIVSVIVGAEGAQAQAFSDRVVCIDDLVQEREELRNAISEIV